MQFQMCSSEYIWNVIRWLENSWALDSLLPAVLGWRVAFLICLVSVMLCVDTIMNSVQEVTGSDGFHYRFEFFVESHSMLGIPFRDVSCQMYVDQHFAVQFMAEELFLTGDSIEIHKGRRVIHLPAECSFLFDEMALEG